MSCTRGPNARNTTNTKRYYDRDEIQITALGAQHQQENGTVGYAGERDVVTYQ
jgi:hypothetical protein